VNRAKFALLACTSLCLCWGSSYAADMPVKAHVAPIAAMDPWVGWYVGGNIGYSWGKTDTATTVGGFTDPFGSYVFPQAASTTKSNVNGIIGGIQAGYVGRIAPTWLGGVEADFQWSGQRGSAHGVLTGDGLYCTGDICSFAHANDVTARLNWFGTFRGRVGPEVNGIWFYGTAGFAYGQVSVSGTNTAVFLDNTLNTVVGTSSTPYSYSQIKGGWTAGIGAEGLIGNGPWRWKAEYLHIDLGNVNGGTFGANPFVQVNTTRFTDDIVRVGFNYKFDDGRRAAYIPVKAAPRALLAWTGWYAGVNAGYIDTIGRTNTNALSAPGAANEEFGVALVNAATNQFNEGYGGFIGGAQVGYNYQFSPSFVAGLEADFQGTTLRRDHVATNTESTTFGWSAIATSKVSNSLDWLGTVRARVGVTPTPSLLIYSTGGLAYGGVRSNTQVGFDNSFNFFPGVTSGSLSDIRVGWTAGGGLEWMFAPNWTTKLEYLYYDLGSASYATGAYDSVFGAVTVATRTSTRFEGNIVRVGLNYKFDTGLTLANH